VARASFLQKIGKPMALPQKYHAPGKAPTDPPGRFGLPDDTVRRQIKRQHPAGFGLLESYFINSGANPDDVTVIDIILRTWDFENRNV